jgi:hypothetical protein
MLPCRRIATASLARTVALLVGFTAGLPLGLTGCEQRAAPPAGASAQGGGRLVDGAVGFSIDIPEGFTTQTIQGVASKIIVGPSVDDFAVNINVVAEPFKGTVSQYVAAGHELVQQQMPDVKLSEARDFVIDAGLPAMHWTMRQTMGGKELVQEQFAVESPGKAFVITCTRVATDTTDWMPIFEKCVKSFRVE